MAATKSKKQSKENKIALLYGKPEKETGKAKTESNELSEEDRTLIVKAVERATSGASYWSDNFKLSLNDLKFLSGDQWPDGIREEREAEGRPCLTNNVLPTFVEQIIGDQLQNKPSIKISSTNVTRVTEASTGKEETLKIKSMTSEKQYELAEVYQGLIRNIEYSCDAEDAYDASFQSAVESGIGCLRVRTDYLTDSAEFEQDIIIEAIENQFSVIIDPMAKKADKSDMNWCFIDDVMTKEAFKDAYPGAISEPLAVSSGEDSTWFTDSTVRVSEYFTREPVVREIALMSDGRTFYLDEIEKVVDELLAKGVEIVKTRKKKTFKTVWRKITGNSILEGPVELKCSTIPVIPVYGKSTTIKNKKIYRSAIRNSIDAQRMANFWDTSATESVALAPKAPYTGTPEEIEGYEDDWENANKANKGILRFNAQQPGDRGPQRQQSALMPSAEIALAMQNSDKIKSTMGMFDASVGARGNETSGRAIIARQREGDTGSYRFIDNLTKAIRRIGRLCVELIPYTYDTERVLRIKLLDETEDFVKLNEQVFDEQSKTWVTINDLGVGKYDVVVTTGPAFSTQRMEAAESMISFAQAVPQAAAVMADLIAQNMDWPGSDVIADRLKKIIPPNVLSPAEREKLAAEQPQQPEEQGPTPEQQLAMKDLEVKELEANAKIAKAEADTFEAQLKTDEAKKQLARIDELAETGDQLAIRVRGLVAEAVAEIKKAEASE